MKTAPIRLAALLSMSALVLCAADPVLYPGAELDREFTDVYRKTGAVHKTAYTTADSFEKVCAFYRKMGTEIDSAKLTTGERKRAAFKLHRQGFQVTVAFPRPGYAKKTSITIARPFTVTQSPVKK